MKRIQVSPNFYLDEFVDPYTYFNDPEHGLRFIDRGVINAAQLLRYLYMKPIYINTWWQYYIDKKDTWSTAHIIKRIEQNKNLRKWSGLRTNRCTIGAKYSAHKKGLAIDLKGNEIDLFKIVKTHAKEFYKLGVRRLEDIRITPGWLHIDLLERNTVKNSIRVVDKTKCTQTIYF